MARKSTRKSRATKPAQSPIRIVTLLDLSFADILIELADGAAPTARPSAREKGKRPAGKQRAKENQSADEETSAVALGSAAPTKCPLKRARTTPAVGTSDRVLRSRQALHTPLVPAPTPTHAEEAMGEERPRKRARTVASMPAGPTSPCPALSPPASGSGLSGPSEGSNMATHRRVPHLRSATSPSVVESTAAPPSEAELPHLVIAPSPPRVRLMGPGMDPYFMF